MKKLFSLLAALTLSVGLWAQSIEEIRTAAMNEIMRAIDESKAAILDVANDNPNASSIVNNAFAAFQNVENSAKLNIAKAGREDDINNYKTDAINQIAQIKDQTIAAIQALPVVGDQFEDATSGLKFEVTAVGDSNIVKVIKNSYSGTTYTVPDTVKYNDVDFAVTEIGKQAFHKCSSLQSITLPEGLLTIGANAFEKCSTLQSITLPASLTEIGNDAFAECALTSITIPAGVTTIGKYTFYSCESLESVTIPAGVTEIGERVFSSCTTLQSITLPEGLLTIGEAAFEACGLTSITIPASVTELVYGAFYECLGLTSVTFLGNACQEAIGEDAFLNVGSTTPALLTLPNSWTGTLPDEEGNWYGGKFEMSSIPTALPNVNAKANATKFMENGQVILRQSDKTYTVLGQEL